MSGSGIITISTRNVDRTRQPMFEAGLESGHYVVISVTDQGVGIPTELMERVFDPFFTTKEGGTGLGLSTAYSYACEQGGTVTLYSEPDKGTTVNVYLRAEPKSPVRSIEQAEQPKGDLTGSETLLLVDDEPILLELGKEILALNGYSVITALSGEEALQVQATSKEPIPLAILDMAMPGINGLETLRRLRDRNPALKAILSSGFHPSPRMESLLASEVDSFINKPYEIDALAREVRRLLDGL
jgi:CheY-like chemotaxis protein